MLLLSVMRMAILTLVARCVLLEVPRHRSINGTAKRQAFAIVRGPGLLLVIVDRLLVHLVQCLEGKFDVFDQGITP